MILYQLIAEGPKRNFDSKDKFHSKNIYKSPPSEQIKEEFKLRCCNSEGASSIFDLVEEETTVKVIELKLED
jgi:hypothetical protein